MPREKEEETNCGQNARHAEAGRFELDISTDDSAKQKQWRQHGNDQGRPLKTARLGFNHRALQPRIANQFGHRARDPLGKERLAPDFFHRFLRAQGEQFPVFRDDFAADLHPLFFVDESLREFRIVAAVLRRTAEVAGIIGDDLVIQRLGDFLPPAHDRRRRADRADRCHPDMLRPECNKGAGRTGIGVDISVSRGLDLHQGLQNFHRRAQLPARSVHIKNVGRSIGRLAHLDDPPEEEKLGFGDLAFERNDHHRARGHLTLEFPHLRERLGRRLVRHRDLCPRGRGTEQDEQKQKKLHHPDHHRSGATLKPNRANSRAPGCPIR